MGEKFPGKASSDFQRNAHVPGHGNRHNDKFV